MALPVTSESYPTPDEVHAQLLNDVRYEYARLGITVNVAKDSDLYIRMRAVANRVSLAVANGQVGLQKTNPLTATGDDLDAWAGVFGISRRAASQSSGYVTITILPPATGQNIPIDFQCTSASGIKYKTTSTAFYNDGDPVHVRSVDSGSGTDLDAGAILTWDSAAIAYLAQKCTVAAGGLDGGADEDDDETLRTRLLRKLSFPAIGGNSAHVIELAEAASSAVSSAYVYSAVRGPSSYDVAIVGDPDDPVLGSSVIDQVAAAIVAEMPGSENLNTTTVTEEPLDVIINLDVPLPVYAGGAGNGWYDAVPWPSDADSALAKITAVSSATNQITVNSTAADPPYVGMRFSIWNPSTQKMVDFASIAIGGGAGAYVITIDSAFATELSWVDTTMYCSASATHLDEYAQAFLAQMKDLGPGEKTSNIDILIFGRREPSPDIQNPYSLTSRALSSISNSFTEIADIAYAARYETGTTNARSTPSIPASTGNAPRQLTLQNLSFRRIA